jgi:hypothetical protein
MKAYRGSRAIAPGRGALNGGEGDCWVATLPPQIRI